MKKSLFMLMLIAAFVAISQLAHAQEAGVAKLTYGPNLWIDAHLLFQMQYTNTYTWDATVEKDSDGAWASDFAARRMRVMFNGQVAPNVTFFIESDLKATGEQYFMFLQDAYINYKFSDELQIAFGMILLPFMHHNRESAVSLLGVDYNTTAINIPEDVVWRDYGIEFRGLLAGGMLDYRIGLFDGIERDANGVGSRDDINPNGLPRIVGRVQVNLMEPETGFFYSGNYLGKKKIVSFGIGIDYMKDATYDNAKNEVNDYFAWTVDATVDYPIDPNMVVAFQAGYVNYAWSPELGVENAYSYYAQAGLLLANAWQPVLRYEATVEDVGGKDVTTAYFHFGLNYFLNGHNANIKIDFRYPMGEDETTDTKQKDLPGEKKLVVQAQIFI